MLVTGLWVLLISLDNKLSIPSLIGLRCGFSIYVGWLSAATILNTCTMLQSYGLTEELAGIDESKYACYILVIAEIIYAVSMFWQKNPLFGAVFVWAMFGIKDRQSGYDNIVVTCQVLIGVQTILLSTLTIYMVIDKLGP